MVDSSIAVMQPYIFPYLGYFQMINAVEVFVFYDDVNFIKQGWINRNKILSNNKESLFTIPVKGISSFRKINETEINTSQFPVWKKKFLKSLAQNYRKAPNFEAIYNLVDSAIDQNHQNISDMACCTILACADYVGISTEFKYSSENHANSEGLEKGERLVHIIKKESKTHYINPIGGQELYKKEFFEERGVKLSFIKSNLPEYSQFDKPFIKGLSIIDILMFNTKSEVLTMLTKYELV